MRRHDATTTAPSPPSQASHRSTDGVRDAAPGASHGRAPEADTDPVPGAREWVTFDDPTESGRRWQFDLTFLCSRWQCIFGAGCQGVHTEPSPELSQGCCSYGAHFSDARDRDQVIRPARELRDDEWQFARVGRARGVVARMGKGWRTRLVDDACIFLNRPGFEAGAGCALHLLAGRIGVHFSDTKPEICWQLPIRRADHSLDDGTVVSVVSEFARSSWGGGGEDFAWWCTEAPEAFTGAEPVYRTMAAELRKTCGNRVYELLVEYIERRLASSMPPPRHPTEVAIALGPTRR